MLKREMFDIAFAKIILKSQINDKAASEIEKCFIEAANAGIVPSYKAFRELKLSTIKEYTICSNCNTVKKSTTF